MPFDPPLSGNSRLEERWMSGDYEELRPLRRRLLEVGGDEVVPAMEPDLDRQLEEGHIIDPTRVVRVEGEPSQCHRNAALLYREQEAVTEIGTGWALSDDGLWRQHSWVMRGDELVETTVNRVQYFGILLAGSKADEFVRKNRF